MYIERDLRKATPLRENLSQSGYLSQCLDLLITYLSSTAPMILGMSRCMEQPFAVSSVLCVYFFLHVCNDFAVQLR